MKFEKALLEDWMRKYYFEVDFDIGSSGVQDFSMAQIRELLGFSLEEIDAVVFHDSQTLGGEGVRKALANRWTDGDADRVMVTHGSTEANFLIMTGLLEAGDEVVVLEPFYQQLYAVAQAVGCRLSRWHLHYENGFRPDFEELRRLVTPSTRMVVVNFPHNPTGATLTREEQQELIEICREAGAYLVWDGAFAELTYGAPPLPDPVLEYEKAISMGTMSKAYGLPGLRVGWCLAAPEVLERFVLLRDYTLLHLSPLVELVAGKVFEQTHRLVGLRLEEAKANREVLSRWIAEHSELVEWVPPQGGVCAFPRLHEDLDVEAFCHRLAQDHRTLLVPGVCFRQPQHVRLGFGGSRENLEGGLARLSTCLAEHLSPSGSRS
ncbi:MAG: capreomycidine synthase [Acidobacteria bacterium]|nr:capreomycidine synthase [Acidobacteriota bacterium]